MNSFQRKSLYAALAGAGALGAVGTAQAVGLNANGLGQVLIDSPTFLIEHSQIQLSRGRIFLAGSFA